MTAACSAAARLGAPLAHDWACVSLSDLLTPWEVIVRRVEAAAQADFVLVFYNPASRTRDWQLAAVAERLLADAPPDDARRPRRERVPAGRAGRDRPARRPGDGAR